METHIDNDVGFLFSGEFYSDHYREGILGIKPTLPVGRLCRIKRNSCRRVTLKMDGDGNDLKLSSHRNQIKEGRVVLHRSEHSEAMVLFSTKSPNFLTCALRVDFVENRIHHYLLIHLLENRLDFSRLLEECGDQW